MARYSAGNTPPYRYWNGIPIYLTTILTAALVVGLIVSAVLAATHSPLTALLVFTTPLEPAWSLWRAVTYIFINPISFFTPFAILFFYWMSTGIETHLGRSALMKLLILLVLTVPVVATAWHLTLGVASTTFGMGNYLFSSGLIVAFATLYPTTEAWGWIPFKWVAFACIACGSLMILADRDWVGLSELWASCGVAFLYVRRAVELEHDDRESPFARLTNWWRRRKFRVVRNADPRPRRSAADTGGPDELDRLLDKIAKSGIASLTPAERTRLEKAREALLKKEGR